MFKIYTSKPKMVEAVQFTDENKDMVRNELTGQHGHGFEEGKPVIYVTTIHGEKATVRLTDWIVKENKLGFYYPVKNDIFRTSYTL